MSSLNNVERISPPSVDALRDQYLLPKQPVIVQGLFDAQPIRDIDTMARVRDQLGDLVVGLVVEPLTAIVEGRPLRDPFPAHLRDWIDVVEADPTVDLRCTEYPTPASLHELIAPPAYCALHGGDDWVSNTFAAARGATAHLHYDRDQRAVLMYQLAGRKRYVVIPVEQTRHLAPVMDPALQRTSGVFLEHMDTDEQLAFLRMVGAWDCVLDPGETLVMPMMAWHYIEYLDTSISVNFRLGRNRYNRFLAEQLPYPSIHLQALASACDDEALVEADPVRQRGLRRLVQVLEARWPGDVDRARALDRICMETVQALDPTGRASRPVSLGAVSDRFTSRRGRPSVDDHGQPALVGWFDEHPDDTHRALRAEALRQLRWYPGPVTGDPVPLAADDLLSEGGVARLFAGLERDGYAHVRLDRALDDRELIGLGQCFGPLQRLIDARMQEYVVDGVILDLRQGRRETADQSWELLFAENYVMMHTELAGAPLAHQPRYQLFQCIDPPVRDHGGQTLLISQDDVLGALDARQRRILGATRNIAFEASPTIVRHQYGREVLAFKDSDTTGFPWACRLDGMGLDEMGLDGVSLDEVNDAIRALLQAMHDRRHLRGIAWEPNMVAVFDNTRWVHGRAFTPLPATTAPRRLREVRALARG